MYMKQLPAPPMRHPVVEAANQWLATRVLRDVAVAEHDAAAIAAYGAPLTPSEANTVRLLEARELSLDHQCEELRRDVLQIPARSPREASIKLAAWLAGEGYDPELRTGPLRKLVAELLALEA